MTNRCLLLLLFLISAAHAQRYVQSAKTGSSQGVVYSRVPLSLLANGIDGELQIVQDSRLTPPIVKELWGTGDLGNDDIRLAFLKSNPLRNATLQIVKSDGTQVQTEDLERPLARLGRVRLYTDGSDTYLVTVDYSAGIGSYSGPATFLVEVKSGRLLWLETAGARTGKNGRISLADTLKSAWKIVPARSGSGKDILQVLCRPDFGAANEFKLIYIRYNYRGSTWYQGIRETAGLWESDESFPEMSLFP